MLNKIKEPLRSVLIALFFLATGILSVLSLHFSDLAKTPAGWTTWDISAVLSPILFIGGIFLLANSKGKDDKDAV